MRPARPSRSLIFLAITIILFTAAIANAQDTGKAEKEDVIRVDTQLVDVPIAVSNPAGLPIGGLKISNFVVLEDGKRQEVTEFSATTAPFEVALLLDTSGSTRADLQLIQRAAMNFIDSLRKGDRVAIIAFRTDRSSTDAIAASDVLTALTDDRAALRSAVENIETSSGTPYYDSLLEVANRIFRERPAEQFRGRRALVALTDGVDSTSVSDFAEARSALQDKGVITFFIRVDTREFFEQNILGDCNTATRFSAAQIRRYYRSLNVKGNMEKAASFCQLGEFERLAVSKRLYEISNEEMSEMATVSGGRVFPIADLNDARTAFRSVADEIGTKYTLGYYPSNDKRDGTYRKITVELRGMPKGSKVRAREGYTAPSN